MKQAMMEPEVPDFDFDAHIAELIARRCVLSPAMFR